MRKWLKPIPVLFLLTAPNFLIIPVSHATDNTLHQTLAGAANIIVHPTQVKYSRLKVVGYKKSNQLALKISDHIAGHPITGKLTDIDKEKYQQLTQLLLDKNNYANIRQRCSNQHFHGVRFIKGSRKVEFAIGIPCNQVFVAFQDDAETKWWGSTLGNVAMKKILGVLGG